MTTGRCHTTLSHASELHSSYLSYLPSPLVSLQQHMSDDCRQMLLPASSQQFHRLADAQRARRPENHSSASMPLATPLLTTSLNACACRAAPCSALLLVPPALRSSALLCTPLRSSALLCAEEHAAVRYDAAPRSLHR